MAKAAADSCPPGWHRSAPHRALPQRLLPGTPASGTRTQGTGAFQQQSCFAGIAAGKGTVSAPQEWNLGQTLIKFPQQTNKTPQQNPHHLHRSLLEEFKHTYAALRASGPGSDSKTLTPSPACEVALFLLFSRMSKIAFKFRQLKTFSGR